MNGNGKWLELIKVVGIQGVIPLYLIYWLTVVFDAKLNALTTSVQHLIAVVEKLSR